MDNSRIEELRRRAQERIQQVRESLERGEGVPEPAASPQPDPMRRAPAPPESLEGPSAETLPPPGGDAPPPPRAPRRPAAEQPAEPSSAAPQGGMRRQAAAGQQPRPAAVAGAHHFGPSLAARVLNRGTLRNAMLVQEILGKPVSLRPPREDENV